MFEICAELVPIDDHDRLVDATPGPDGVMLGLWATENGAQLLGVARNDNGDRYRDVSGELPVSARVITYAPEPRDVVPVEQLWLERPRVGMFTDGAVLILGARCEWSPDGAEHNACIFGPDGTPERTGILGDGIEHAGISASDDIWVGYFDEGVFGSNYWSDPGPEPMGAAGLVRFDRSLSPTWSFGDSGRAVTGPPAPTTGPASPTGEAGWISDCYALNVDGDTAWACYYTEFPIARITRDGETTIWRTPAAIEGITSLVVADDRVGLYGGYAKDKNRLLIGRLADDGFTVEHEDTLPIPIPDRHYTSLHGIGDTLHLVTGNRWYQARPLR